METPAVIACSNRCYTFLLRPAAVTLIRKGQHGDPYRYFGFWASQKPRRILGPMRTSRNGRGVWRHAVMAVLAASLPLAAVPINVTDQTTASLSTDDALFFTLATYGFAIDATAFGLSPYPAIVSFGLVSSAPGPGGLFDAALETPSGSVIAMFPELLEFVPAQYQSASDSGPVGDLEASLTLSPALSQQLFSGASAVLMLQNLGPTASVGLSSYTIPHDLTISLSEGGLTTGAPVVEATLDDPPAPGGVPEPGSGWLLAGGAALCWAAAATMKRARRRGAGRQACSVPIHRDVSSRTPRPSPPSQ